MNFKLRAFVTLLFFSFNFLIAHAQDNKFLTGIPVDEKPLQVQVGFNLMDITDVSEKQETIDFDGALYLNWIDTRLAYDQVEAGMLDFVSGDYSHAPSRIYQGDFAVKEIFEGWRPFIVIPNGIGDRSITNMTISVWPDGKVEYSETFYAKIETPMDLRMFPFDKHALEIYFHPINYKNDELILIPDDHLARKWNKNTGIAEWIQGDIIMGEAPTEIAYFDESKDTISEFSVIINIKREPLHVLVSIILPLVILVSLTWCVFWIDEGDTIFARVNILFIGILSVIAYYIIIQDNIPKISYLTLIDGFILTTFLVLATGVLITVIVHRFNEIGKGEIANKIDRICRWAFPLGYALITLLLGLLVI
jgi:hypothetical protein